MYHLRVKFLKRSEGKSSVRSAAYRSGTKLYDEREDKTYDYTKKRDVEYSEIMLPEHLPASLRQREAMWNAMELGIKRKDGQPAFEVEVALPRELSREQCRDLAREFAHDMFVAKGLAVDLNIHRSVASDGGEHPHAHILIGTRRFNPDGSVGKVATDMQDSPAQLRKIFALEKDGKFDEAVLASSETNLGFWRRSWEDYSNRFLDEAGETARIDHRTLEAQSIHREAWPNIGFAFYDRLRAFKGHLAERVERFKQIEWRKEAKEQFERVYRKAPNELASFVAHARAYAPDLYPELVENREPERQQEYER